MVYCTGSTTLASSQCVECQRVCIVSSISACDCEVATLGNILLQSLYCFPLDSISLVHVLCYVHTRLYHSLRCWCLGTRWTFPTLSERGNSLKDCKSLFSLCLSSTGHTMASWGFLDIINISSVMSLCCVTSSVYIHIGFTLQKLE